MGRPFARKIPTDVDWMKFAAKCQERGITFKPINVGAVLAGIASQSADDVGDATVNSDLLGELASSVEVSRTKKRKSTQSFTPNYYALQSLAQQQTPLDENGLPSLQFIWQQLRDVSQSVQRLLMSCEAALKVHEQHDSKRQHTASSLVASDAESDTDSGDELEPTSLQL